MEVMFNGKEKSEEDGKEPEGSKSQEGSYGFHGE